MIQAEKHRQCSSGAQPIPNAVNGSGFRDEHTTVRIMRFEPGFSRTAVKHVANKPVTAACELSQ